MKNTTITIELVKKFIKSVSLEIYEIQTGKISTVGVKYGWCKKANDEFGRNTVLKILDLLENDFKYQRLLN